MNSHTEENFNVAELFAKDTEVHFSGINPDKRLRQVAHQLKRYCGLNEVVISGNVEPTFILRCLNTVKEIVGQEVSSLQFTGEKQRIGNITWERSVREVYRCYIPRIRIGRAGKPPFLAFDGICGVAGKELIINIKPELSFDRLYSAIKGAILQRRRGGLTLNTIICSPHSVHLRTAVDVPDGDLEAYARALRRIKSARTGGSGDVETNDAVLLMVIPVFQKIESAKRDKGFHKDFRSVTYLGTLGESWYKFAVLEELVASDRLNYHIDSGTFSIEQPTEEEQWVIDTLMSENHIHYSLPPSFSGQPSTVRVCPTLHGKRVIPTDAFSEPPDILNAYSKETNFSFAAAYFLNYREEVQSGNTMTGLYNSMCGLVVKDGKMLFPPHPARPALLWTEDKFLIKVLSLDDLLIRASDVLLIGENAATRILANSATTLLKDFGISEINPNVAIASPLCGDRLREFCCIRQFEVDPDTEVEVAIFTSAYGKETPSWQDRLFFTVYSNQVISVQKNKAPIPSNGFVISLPSKSLLCQRFFEHLLIDNVLDMQIIDEELVGLTQALAAGPTLLQRGKLIRKDFFSGNSGLERWEKGKLVPMRFPHDVEITCAARTCIGRKPDGDLVILVADQSKREPYFSIGLTLHEQASLLAAIGVCEAINLDGGGSAFILYSETEKDFELLNQPSDIKPLRFSPAIFSVSVE